MFGLSKITKKTRLHRLAPLPSRSALIHFVLLSFALCAPLQSVLAKKIVLLPFQAPHLSKSQLNKQTKILYKKLQKIRGIKMIPLSQSKRTIRRQKFALTLLKKPTKAKWSVKRLCYALKSNYAISVSMKLGTDTKPAKLVAVLFRCQNSEEALDYISLPFEGRLSKQVWTILSEDLEELLTSPEPQRRPTSSYASTNTTPAYRNQTQSNRNLYPRPSRQTPPLPPPSVMPPANTGMLPPNPSMSVSPSRVPRNFNEPNYALQADPSLNSRLQIDTPMTSGQARMEASRFQVFAGSRVLTKVISYSTQADSRSLQGGLRYESGWLNGWGAQLQTRLSRSRRLSVFGEYELYNFTSFRMINNLFTVPGTIETKSLALQSSLKRWSGGFRYAHPIQTRSLVHQGGLQVVYQGSLMDIENNTDFLGLDMHRAEFGIFGEFIVSPERFYLALNTGFYPFVYLGNRSEEFGASAESYGINSKINFRYRSDDGLSLNLYIKLDFTFIDPIGEGRDGRLGKTARDQTISIGLDLGYASPP